VALEHSVPRQVPYPPHDVLSARPESSWLERDQTMYCEELARYAGPSQCSKTRGRIAVDSQRQ